MSKKIIICADGTWNEPEQLDRGSLVPTNVVKIARALALAKRPDQEDIYYDLGVGTNGWLDRLLGGLTGNGLMTNIFDCYHFIAERYQPGDKIYLFGFSRGAYTVRSLAGLICNFGLNKDLVNPELIRTRHEQPAITTAENRPVEESHQKAKASQNTLRELQGAYQKMKAQKTQAPIDEYQQNHDCYHPGIEMIGVWDTVGALGIPFPIPKELFPEKLAHWLNSRFLGVYRFLNADLNPKVKAAYHAISIDENRRSFMPTLWNETSLGSGQTVKQVWFAGIHSNIGGGYADAGLSDNALLWMIRQAQEHGLQFSEAYLTKNIHPDAFYGEMRNERSRLLKRILFRKGLRQIEILCNDAGAKPIIAESAIERQASRICKQKYKLNLQEDFRYEIEKGF
ncbi:DUF2235 domain-containing protein [Larkinella insperata]|uniref:DUF2235 domain-containing protein n=1 Tax=Larkinella insperata TaxID=332158 RepID=A0ABW3Q220_9BACT|nr:DUF2235 domain-containing protein [Larkinella insperata]